MPHGISGSADRGDSGGGDVEPERGAEFPVVEFDDGFLFSFSARRSSEEKRLRLARLATVAWALVLFALAVLALHRVGRVIEVGLQIASVAYGALLGVFLLGVLTRRANQSGAIVGMICGLAVELYLWGWSHVAFTWWVAIGTCVDVRCRIHRQLLVEESGTKCTNRRDEGSHISETRGILQLNISTHRNSRRDSRTSPMPERSSSAPSLAAEFFSSRRR